MLSELAEIKSGGTPSRSKTEYYNGVIPWAKISDIESARNGVIEDTEEHISEKGLEAIRNRIFDEGTLLFAMYGSVGKIAFAGTRLSTNQAILGINPKGSDLSSKYLYYWFILSKNRLLDQANGVALKNLSATIIRNTKIPLPPLPIQRKIAEVLDAADRIRQRNKEVLAKYDQLAQSVFLDMFGDHQLFDLLPISEVAANKKYSLSSGPFGSNLTSKHYTDSGVIILRGTNITSGKLDLSNVKYISVEKAEELIRSQIRPGDLVIVAVGSSGKALQIPNELDLAVMSQNFNKITPDLKKVTPTYLEFCFNSQLVQNQFSREMTDTVRTFLSLTKIKEVKIPVPPINLQNQFATIIKNIEQQKAKAQAELEQSEALFGSLMQKAFNGALFDESRNQIDHG